MVRFLSTPSARRATINFSFLCMVDIRISIHALREEGDFSAPLTSLRTSEFLSTPSARRATWLVGVLPQRAGISIHALREEGDDNKERDNMSEKISIHALREEGDPPAPTFTRHSVYFYPRPPRGGRQEKPRLPLLLSRFLSTPSARRATHAPGEQHIDRIISIHALREEGDRGVHRRPVRF